ncbi:hypothetical protein [Albidovulum sediminis]|uniref:Uncharacterized protein n=1 Tax=Albidovulum sediminis TaxID=3066345 RepID=A0ABT2NNP6_9RHOB|nr:hypothetical protein [Defluviimonas sediminis]MCT8330558.1 hypothetical protein [Defluviimonas sediminis]
MRSRAPTFTAVALALALVLTGFAAASARGRAVDGAGTTIVLCSAGGLLQVTLDAKGNPTGESHLCPDLAFSLIAAVSLSPAEVHPVRLPDRLAASFEMHLPCGHPVPERSARAPPGVA